MFYLFLLENKAKILIKISFLVFLSLTRLYKHSLHMWNECVAQILHRLVSFSKHTKDNEIRVNTSHDAMCQ